MYRDRVISISKKPIYCLERTVEQLKRLEKKLTYLPVNVRWWWIKRWIALHDLSRAIMIDRQNPQKIPTISDSRPYLRALSLLRVVLQPSLCLQFEVPMLQIPTIQTRLSRIKALLARKEKRSSKYYYYHS